ncbi:MAG: bifunctional 2-polyprenyl-6-hydroxyphenol methylase/3-demethylubiquinol 3-O-methyltransferase UbiG [Caedimonas sp.]|nr:bifunctional 2-polyprenyl-6-hydroxyphenol methylase/3-demethylubiquinol 3-O-methyltransferase UbiG [Caedimonas sp.]
MNKEHPLSVDPHEIRVFEALADEWWRPQGAFRPLHLLNPARLDFVRQQISGIHGESVNPLMPYAGLRIIDVGCGGGILSEPLARCGAHVTGIDAGANAIAAARCHAQRQGLAIDYRTTTAEECAGQGETYDVVIAMEVVEHVADVQGFIMSLAALAKPGGVIILSTINRTLKSYAVAIVGAEYIMRLLPKGTHHWNRFLKPSELARCCRHAKLEVRDIQGMCFRPWYNEFTLSKDLSVNYMLSAQKR